MNVASVYRAVLKTLSRACKTRPHFVQDVRFLLSLPLLSHNDKHTVVPGTRPKLTAASSTLTNAAPFEILEEVHGFERTTVENYLQRPASTCYPVDTEALFTLCYADLQCAVRQPPQSDSNVNAVAQQILRYRNLLWLRDRLARVLSDKTTTQLGTSLSIADGPDTADFIPDEFFKPTNCSQQSGAAITTVPRDGPAEHESGVASSEMDLDREGKVAQVSLLSSSSSTHNGAAQQSGSAASAATAESDSDVVYSAGAIGLQREMFVLRHREAFPMAVHFLSGFPTVPAAELASCAHQQAALVRLVREKYPTTVTCEDGRVSLSVSVEPFDPQYRTREHAGMGYFATAHRQFRVQFSLQPLVLDGAVEVEETEVVVVNSYFARLDMEAMQVIEEVGYLHSRDVLRMLRERDYCDHFSGYLSDAVTEALGEGEEEKTSTGGRSASAEKKLLKSKPQDSDVTSSSPSGNAREFSLFFLNPTDAPMVLKGMLYYKLGKRNELTKSPIQCVPFGFVLMEA